MSQSEDDPIQRINKTMSTVCKLYGGLATSDFYRREAWVVPIAAPLKSPTGLDNTRLLVVFCQETQT